MIDDKEIEEAAINKCGFISFEFCSGANWMQEEFLKNLWHDVFKERIPHGKRVIVEYTFEGGLYYRSLKIPDDIQWVRGFSCEKRLRRWLYLDDLFPKEGGNHD